MTSSAFDTSQVKDKRDTINGRFQRIKTMAAARRAKLNESHRLHQFFRDMDDEESWIKYVLLQFNTICGFIHMIQYICWGMFLFLL